MEEGGGAYTSGVEGKERRKKEKWGRERRALYEREKKRDERGWVGWLLLMGTVKEMEGGMCKNFIGFGGFVERERR
jgi:hypothetical protein